MKPMRLVTIAACVAAALVMSAQPEGRGRDRSIEDVQQPQAKSEQESFRFRSGVELINVTATVTDHTGRFVAGLRKEDFRVYQDDELQPVTHFNSERVPISLGIVLDTSGSMVGEKMAAAREALNRFLSQLLDVDDEVFLYRFDVAPVLVEGWTTDKRALSLALARLRPNGGTAMYDAVAQAVPLAQMGRHRKKALLVISDGNDTSSHTDVQALKRMIRETEVLVYAIGIDTQTESAPWPRRFTLRSFQTQGTPPAPAAAAACAHAVPVSVPRAPAPKSAADQPPDLPAGPAREQHAAIAGRRGRQRGGAAGHHRRQRRAHGNRPRRTRSRSGDRRHRR